MMGITRKHPPITITTFWVDWLLLPIMIAFGFITLRWSLADYRLTRYEYGKSILFSLSLAIPLAINALAWVITGLASLIKEEYYELRVWRIVLFLWTMCSLLGGLLTSIMYMTNDTFSHFNSIAITLGLILVAFIIGFPAFLKIPTGKKADEFSFIWTILIFISTVLLLYGVLQDFPYNFPKLMLAVCFLFFFASGSLEFASKKPIFPWFPRVWKKEEFGKIEEFEKSLPISNLWRIVGFIKIIISIFLIIVFILKLI